MKSYILLIFTCCTLSLVAQKKEQDIITQLEAKTDFYDAIAKTIWANPELGYLEENSSALLQKPY